MMIQKNICRPSKKGKGGLIKDVAGLRYLIVRKILDGVEIRDPEQVYHNPLLMNYII